MTRNPHMTEEEWRLFELWRNAHRLSNAEIESLEETLRLDPRNIDVRVQLFAHYHEFEGNALKHKGAEQKLLEQVLWLIANKPSASGFLGHRLGTVGHCFKPKAFARARQAWLEQVSKTPFDGNILGNAASFISWYDIETASELFERAYALQPEAGWLQLFVIHCNSVVWSCPSIYKDKLRHRVIDAGVRSLETEIGGAPFLVCEYVSDAALSLRRFEIVRRCAETLRNWGAPTCDQMANAYLGLVALREDNRELAVRLMLEVKRGYQPQPIVFRLARELFDAGERESVGQLIKGFNRKIKSCARKRLLEQISRDQPPEFEVADYCFCRMHQ